MKTKQLIGLFVMLFGVITMNYSQEFQGKAVYQSKTKFDMSRLPADMSPDQKARIKERLKSRLERIYELDFSTTESEFKVQAQAEVPGQGGGNMRMFGGGEGVNYKNLKEKQFAKEREITGKKFLIKDSLVAYNWQMTSESRMIGKYLVFKAIAAVTKENSPQVRWGRRPPQSSDSTATKEPETPEVEFITAWYTLDIPVSNGPADYWGLPGLILEVSQGETTMLCTKIVLNPSDEIKIKEPSKGKVLTQAEFDKLLSEKMEEMRDRYGRGQGRGGNRVIIRN
ncbi:MAG: GLPGLI family protein [Flavobacteriaceae bacterium]